jgi:aminoglycoside phosphotransferase (APT) family kinase protein
LCNCVRSQTAAGCTIGVGYPFAWSVCTGLPGDNATGTVHDLEQAAVDLAAFVLALHRTDRSDGPRRPRGRGGPLAARDLIVIDGHLRGVIDWGCLDAGDPAVDLLLA